MSISANYKGLSADDIRKLWKDYKKTRSQELRNKLIEIYLPTVKYIASVMASRMPHSVNVEDLISPGVIGLIDAIEKFDLKRGIKFETYCSARIRGAILDELRELDWVPRLVRTRLHKLQRAYDKLESIYKRAPTDIEISKELGISLKRLDELLMEVSAASCLHTERKWQEKEKDPTEVFVEIAEDHKQIDPLFDVQKSDLVNFITKFCSRKERLILLLYYYEELTMKEIGATLGLSESRVSQLHAKLVVKLKSQLRKKRPELL